MNLNTLLDQIIAQNEIINISYIHFVSQTMVILCLENEQQIVVFVKGLIDDIHVIKTYELEIQSIKFYAE